MIAASGGCSSTLCAQQQSNRKAWYCGVGGDGEVEVVVSRWYHRGVPQRRPSVARRQSLIVCGCCVVVVCGGCWLDSVIACGCWMVVCLWWLQLVISVVVVGISSVCGSMA